MSDLDCFYDPATELHDPIFRLTAGALARNAEQAERAHLLLRGLDRMGLTPQQPEPAPGDLLRRVHSERFLNFLETAWSEWEKLPGHGPEVVPNLHPMNAERSYPAHILGRAGWHLSDTSAPIGPRSWQATLAAAGTACSAAKAVLGGSRAAYALCRPPGHHTAHEVAAGHCLLNGTAIAAEAMRAQHARVAVLDIDVHHGNGTQDIFYERDDVLTVSVHAATEDYYPFFTGYAHETGHGTGAGYNLNLPLPRTTTDDAWCAALGQALDRVAEFAPGALVVALGLDAHENDPLMGMKITFDGFRRAGRMIADAGLPTVLVQEGGYLSPDLTTSLVSFLSGFLGRDPDQA